MVITELFLIAIDSNRNAHPVTDAGINDGVHAKLASVQP